MSDWAVGDLALFVRGTNCGGHTETPRYKLVDGAIYRVCRVRHGPFRPVPGNACQAPSGLFLAEHYSTGGFCSECFRKILPDKHEACETEFVTLLKRSKQPITALNKQSERDGA